GNGQRQEVAGVVVDAAGVVTVTGTLRGAVDFGGGPLVSAGSADVFVARFDRAGRHVASVRAGDAAYQTASDVALDPTGNVLLAGGFQGILDLGPASHVNLSGIDVFVAKLDASGRALWSLAAGDASEQKAMAIASDGAGNVVVAGVFHGALDLGGG